jgi:anti-sigma B factor antagonist
MAGSEIIITLDEDAAYVRVIGEGTQLNALYLKKSCQNLLHEGVDRFILDFAECTLLDSTFLGTLAGFALKRREAGREPIRVSKVNAELMKLMRNLGLERLFVIDPA